ncbi:hypothetical protein ABW21_db0200406 [Orbilia brochopaga]|nr:hypothetical protein ABW21_db0200406 [Drechslerella brochopaga]
MRHTTGSAPRYLPCEVRFTDPSSSVAEAIRSGQHQNGTQFNSQMQEIADEIIRLMNDRCRPDIYDHSQPPPLIFLVNTDTGSPNVTFVNEELLATKLDTNANTKVLEYEPRFWLPSDCVKCHSPTEMARRREFFAAGCLIFEILSGKKPWSSLLDSVVKQKYQNGYYPPEVKELSHYLHILMFWSQDFAEIMQQKLHILNKWNVWRGTLIIVGSGAALLFGAAVTAATNSGEGTSKSRYKFLTGTAITSFVLYRYHDIEIYEYVRRAALTIADYVLEVFSKADIESFTAQKEELLKEFQTEVKKYGPQVSQTT